MDKDFLDYLFRKTYRSVYQYEQYKDSSINAFNNTLADFRYHYPEKDEDSIAHAIEFGTGWFVTYLYRLGRSVFLSNNQDPLLQEIHWLMRELCAAEIYFSVDIGKGLYVRHGLGTVIGSRCQIGEGLVIHQNCTIGHKKKLGNGPTLLNNVEIGAGSTLLGDITIGNHVTIGAHSLVLHSFTDGLSIAGTPAKKIK